MICDPNDYPNCELRKFWCGEYICGVHYIAREKYCPHKRI